MSKQRTSTAPATPLSCRILRSPSHESVTTDLSLFSVSSMTSDAFGGASKHRLITFKEHRGPSPNPDIKGVHMNKPADIPEIMWLEDGNDIILSCAQLSSVLGIQKSFSTSDITQLPSKINGTGNSGVSLSNVYTDLQSSNSNQLRHAVSELALNSLQRCGYMLDSRLEHASRSCSTWVAVGELASTSQLPSPHGGPAINVNTSSSQQQLTAANANIQSQPAFTAADLIRSVNKKVRQNYIRRRLLTTYRAIERLSQSEFNLDQLEAAAVAATVNAGPGPTELAVPIIKPLEKPSVSSAEPIDIPAVVIDDSASSKVVNSDQVKVPVVADGTSPASTNKPKNIPVICPQLKNKISMNINRNLTIHDIEKERGRPLSKYDRNMMIFNWLHSLDETSTVEEYNMI